jgi:glycosyltransferase involved in cell wall biosynthesis
MTATTEPADPGRYGVCVVAVAYNRASMLSDLVDALAAQTHPAIEFVIVDNGSTDSTASVLRAVTAHDPRFRILSIAENRGPARARNLAWRSTDQPWVAFTDDDCRPDPRWVEQLLAAAVDGTDIVQGHTVPPAEEAARAGRFDKVLWVGRWSGRYETCNLLVRRSLLQDLGGFNERFRIAMGEDADLGLRAEGLGVRSAYTSGAVVVHPVVYRGFRGYLRDRWRWADVVALVRENPDGRRYFPLGCFASRRHILFYGALPVVAVSLWKACWSMPLIGIVGWCVYRAFRTRARDGSIAIGFIRGGMELIGLTWEVTCFAIKSVRYRRVLL